MKKFANEIVRKYDRAIWTVCRPIRIARRAARRLRTWCNYGHLWTTGWMKLWRARYSKREKFTTLGRLTISPMGTPVKVFAAPCGDDTPRILRATVVPEDDNWFLMYIAGSNYREWAVLHGSFPCLVQPFEEWDYDLRDDEDCPHCGLHASDCRCW